MRWKRIRWILAVVVLVALGVTASWFYRVASSFAGSGGSIMEVGKAIVDPRSQFPGQSKLVILILGKDYNHDRKGMAYTKDARADTIMLLSADLETKKLSAVSIPRDTKVTAPDGMTGKINAVLQRGGVDLMRQTISTQFGITIDNYVMLKPDAVREIVNSVGGVEVETIDEMFYEDSWGNLFIDLPKGRIRVDGKQAVGYVRFRKMGTHRIGEGGRKIPVRQKSSLEEGDIRRTERQQLLIKAIVSEANNPENLWKADKIIETGFGQIETDLTRPQVLALGTLFKGNQTKMQTATLPGEDSMEGGAYYWVLDYTRAARTIDWILRGDEYAGRNLIRVSIYNTTKVPGVARLTADILDAFGFDAFSSGNTREKPAATEIVYRKASHEAYAREIAEKLGATVVRKDTEADPRADWLPEVKVYIAEDRAQALMNESQGSTTSGTPSS